MPARKILRSTYDRFADTWTKRSGVRTRNCRYSPFRPVYTVSVEFSARQPDIGTSVAQRIRRVELSIRTGEIFAEPCSLRTRHGFAGGHGAFGGGDVGFADGAVDFARGGGGFEAVGEE